MLVNPEDELDRNLAIGGGDTDSLAPEGPAAPPAPPSSIEELKQAQADADRKKAWLGVAGTIAQGLADRPSAYELYTGKKSARPDFKAMTDAAAGAIQNPMDQQQKAFAYLKAKNEANQAQAQSAFADSLKDDTSDAAKAFKQAAGVPAGMTAAQALAQGFNPSKIAEIRAKAQTDNDASLKKFMLEEKIRRADQKEVKQTETDKKDAADLDAMLAKGWTARSGQAGSVEGRIMAAERAEALLQQAKTQPGGLDSRQTEELATSTANLLGGGSSASERVSQLIPHTSYGAVAKGLEYAGFGPQGLKQGEYTDRLAETIAREKALAVKQKQEHQAASLPRYSNFAKNQPALYGNILSSHGLSPEAIQSAKAGGEKPTVLKTLRNKKTGEIKQVMSDGTEINIPSTAGN